MERIDEINKSLSEFLRQQTICEAQIKAYKNMLSLKIRNSSSKQYFDHLLNLLYKGLQKGKLTSEGKEIVLLSQNSAGDLLVIKPIKRNKYKKSGQGQKKGKLIASKIPKKSKGTIGAKITKDRKEKDQLLRYSKEKQEKTKKLEAAKYSSLTIGEIAETFNVSFSTLLHILGVGEGVKEATDTLNNQEFEKISPLIVGKLTAIKRNQKADKKIKMGIKVSKKKSGSGAGVFDKIQSYGGLGKVIYTRMKG